MKTSVYVKLESKMVRYRDLTSIPVADNGESIVRIPASVIANGYTPQLSDMTALFGPEIIVRKSVLLKLREAQSALNKFYPSLTLYVTYGYRSLDVQTNRFINKLSELAKTRFFMKPADLYEEVHRFIAAPTVAGHPTGGAVDVTIKNTKTGTLLDFGSEQYDYSSKDCYVFAPVNTAARRNRALLRDIMTQAGFAPFDGEWWHFSYGDREWAYYYKKPKAIYNQLSVTITKESLRRGA